MNTVDPFSQAKQYLARVLPWPNAGEATAYVNVHWTFRPKNGQIKTNAKGKELLPWSGRAVSSVAEAISAIQFALKNADTRDIYACLSTQRESEERTSTKGWRYRVPIRLQQNAVAVKSLWLDIDAKGTDNNSYANLTDAAVALSDFVKAVRLPKPSIIVGSGGGLHVYWVVASALTIDEWKPLAFALAEATKRHGLKCDTQCTIDAARVLRIPNTFNHKTEPPRPVTIVGKPTDFDYSVDRLAKALEPYKVAIPAAAAAVSFMDDPALFPPRQRVADELGAGIESSKGPPPKIEDVAYECAFIRDALATGGATYSNPLWNLTTLISTFTEGGRVDAHRMGKGHPGYSQADTDALFDRKAKEKAEKNLGWPACRTISGSGCGACQLCPHLAADKSPLSHARKPKPVAPVAALVTAAPAVAVPDLPRGYARDVGGVVCEVLIAEDGSQTQVPLCDYAMIEPWLQAADETGVLHFNTTIRGRTKHIMLPLDLVGTNDMRKWLQSQDLMLPIGGKSVERVGRFFVAWVKVLQETRDVVKSSPFGWAVDKGKTTGFVYGGSMWMPTGAKQAALGDTITARHYEPTGEIEPWITAAKMITDQHRPAVEVMLASAFAAPLVRFTGEAGVLLSAYSAGSGAGKSTVLKVAQAVWGDPVLAVQSLDDTQNSVMNKIGEIRALPLYWDEIKTQEHAKKFVNITFQVTQGKEKARLNNRINQREPGKWQTLLMSASNESVMEYITKYTTTTTAGIYRVFEFEVPKPKPGDPGQIVPSDASIMVAKLQDNYGRVGLEYARFLGTNHAKVAADIQAEMAALNKELKTIPEERFWVLLIASTLLGARYANGLRYDDGGQQKQIVTFHEADIRKFLIAQLHAMRKYRTEQPVDMDDKFNVIACLSSFLNAKRERNTIITNRIHIVAGPPQAGSIKILSDVQRLSELHVHIAKDMKRMRINAAALGAWLDEKGMSRNNVVRAMNKDLMMQRHKGVLGGGTPFRLLTDYFYEIDMTVDPALLEFLN